MGAVIKEMQQYVTRKRIKKTKNIKPKSKNHTDNLNAKNIIQNPNENQNPNQNNATLKNLIRIIETAGAVEEQTDKYFTHTRKIVEKNGEAHVVYAFFMRRRIIAAIEPALICLKHLVPNVTIKRFFQDGMIVPAEKSMIEVSGPMSQLAEVETMILQKIGFPSVCAHNAYDMCRAAPNAYFIDMHPRHATGAEMNILAAYGAAVGSRAAQKENPKIKGFIGASQDLIAPLYGQKKGIGTMPHSLIGYTNGDVLKALKLFYNMFPKTQRLIALIDYSGREVSDALRCAKWFYKLPPEKRRKKIFGVRIDAHGGRFIQNLDYATSVKIVGEWLNITGEYNIVEYVIGTHARQLDSGDMLVDMARRVLFGQGVSVAAAIHIRKTLDKAGFKNAEIVVSSGFNPKKCRLFAAAKAPIDIIGTGSFLPETFAETYATADIISYDGIKRVKLGREYLFTQ